MREGISRGDLFPILSEAGLVGKLPDTKGKVVLVDFWASWCGPCKESFPALSRLQKEFAARGLVIVGVGVDDRVADHEAFIKRMAPAFSTVHDAADRLAEKVSPPAMPTSYLIGRDGRVREVLSGYRGAVSERELRKHIEAILAEK